MRNSNQIWLIVAVVAGALVLGWLVLDASSVGTLGGVSSPTASPEATQTSSAVAPSGDEWVKARLVRGALVYEKPKKSFQLVVWRAPKTVVARVNLDSRKGTVWPGTTSRTWYFVKIEVSGSVVKGWVHERWIDLPAEAEPSPSATQSTSGTSGASGSSGGAPTPTPTPIKTVAPSASPTRTVAPTPTPTPTKTPRPSPTSTPTPTPTAPRSAAS